MIEQDAQLARLSYDEVAKRLAPCSTDQLTRLLNSKSIKVGDTAASLISERNEVSSVIPAFHQHLITTRNGKMRVAYLLGRETVTRDALRVLLSLVMDRVDDVADAALFSIVKRGGPSAKHRLAEIAPSDVTAKTRERLARAIEAIEKSDPRIYSPNYGG